MTKAEKNPEELSYSIRPPGRPRKPAPSTEESGEDPRVQASASQAAPAGAEAKSLRFEMRLPPGVVADLELMRERTGGTYANYIRNAILRALEEDKERWKK